MDFIIAIVALIGGFIFGFRFASKSMMHEVRQVEKTQAIDRANYIQTLRREVANILVWRDPRRYLRLYEQLHAEVLSLASWRPEEISKQLTELWARYPYYSDFDVLHTREYVLYSYALLR